MRTASEHFRAPAGNAKLAGKGAEGQTRDICISATGLFCLAGDQPFALLGAVAAPLCGARPHPSLTAPLPHDQEGESPLLTAAVSELAGVDDPSVRMAALVAGALAGVLPRLDELPEESSLLVMIGLPSAQTPRGAMVQCERWEEDLRRRHPRLSCATFRWIRNDQTLAEPFGDACQQLGAGQWDAILLGAVDSLVDELTCAELVCAGRAATTSDSEGGIPGEAAAFVLLQSSSAKRPRLAWLRGVGRAAEPHAGLADEKPMTGLVRAIGETLQQAGLAAKAVDAVVFARGGEKGDCLEWHQVKCRHWPPAKPQGAGGEPERGAPEELQLHPALGDTGAAALVVSMVLACARLEFDHPRVDCLALVDAGDASERGVILLSR